MFNRLYEMAKVFVKKKLSSNTKDILFLQSLFKNIKDRGEELGIVNVYADDLGINEKNKTLSPDGVIVFNSDLYLLHKDKAMTGVRLYDADVLGGYNYLSGENTIKAYLRGYSFKEARWGFHCSRLFLDSLEGCPKIVGTHFIATKNRLTSLQGLPEVIKGQEYVTTFDFGNNRVSKLPIIPEDFNLPLNINLESNDITILAGIPYQGLESILINRMLFIEKHYDKLLTLFFTLSIKDRDRLLDEDFIDDHPIVTGTIDLTDNMIVDNEDELVLLKELIRECSRTLSIGISLKRFIKDNWLEPIGDNKKALYTEIEKVLLLDNLFKIKLSDVDTSTFMSSSVNRYYIEYSFIKFD